MTLEILLQVTGEEMHLTAQEIINELRSAKSERDAEEKSKLSGDWLTYVCVWPVLQS